MGIENQGRLSYTQALSLLPAAIGAGVCDLEAMQGVPSHRRRCIEEMVINAAMDLAQDSANKEAAHQGLGLESQLSKASGEFAASMMAYVKWQVVLNEAGQESRDVWVDLQDTWACKCETVFQDTASWTDCMWDKVSDMDAPPQVDGTDFEYLSHVIEFHRGEAVQVNMLTCSPTLAERYAG